MPKCDVVINTVKEDDRGRMRGLKVSLFESENYEECSSYLDSRLFIRDIDKGIKVWEIDRVFEYWGLSGCYVYYDEYNTCLYVGEAKNLYNRFEEHIRGWTGTNEFIVEDPVSVNSEGDPLLHLFNLNECFHHMDIWILDTNDADARKLLEQFLFLTHKPLHNNYSNVKGNFPECIAPALKYKQYISRNPNFKKWTKNDKDNFNNIIWKKEEDLVPEKLKKEEYDEIIKNRAIERKKKLMVKLAKKYNEENKSK
ncbi:GIY-YIG nuclease family protein [Bacillus sp. BC08]